MIKLISHDEILGQFVESVSLLLNDIDEKHKEMKKVKESDRTKAYHTEKLLKKWFFNHGGI